MVAFQDLQLHSNRMKQAQKLTGNCQLIQNVN